MLQNFDKNKNIAILGLGSWGMALGMVLDDNGYNVRIWDINDSRIKILSETRKFDLLPWINISENIFLSSDLKEVCSDCDLIVFAVPSHAVRNVAEALKNEKNIFGRINDKIFLSVAKGIENETYFNMTEVIQDVFKIDKNRIFALSGPTHAEEVSKKILTTVIVAGLNENTSKKLQNIFSNNYFRVYITKDVKGVELGAAAKNIIAIAAGIADGLGLGDNAKAAVITRGLFEIARLGKKIGAKPETFYGLSGLGDLVVTCISQHSRNRYFGEKLGKGESTEKILAEMKMVAEGVNAAKSIYKLAEKENVEMPIVKEVYDIIYNKKIPKNAVINLMRRTLKEENFF